MCDGVVIIGIGGLYYYDGLGCIVVYVVMFLIVMWFVLGFGYSISDYYCGII